MEFNIAFMYYDLLELYGDRGNITVLEAILKFNNINYNIEKITINQKKDISNYDFVFLGGGTDQNQLLVEEDLKLRKNQMINVMKNKGFILTVCGGYQMFGKYYLDAHSNKIEGLGIFDYYTQANDKRCVGNIKIVSKIKNEGNNIEIIGFENHSGITKGIDSNTCFGEVILGNGNEYKSKYEGYMDEFFIGTYIHGPLLPKNPYIAKYIIEKVLKEKYNLNKNIDLPYLDIVKKAKKSVRF